MGLSDFTSQADDTSAGGGAGGNGSGNGMGGFGPNGYAPSAPPQGPDDSLVESMLVDYNKKFAAADAVLFRDELIEQMLAVLIGKNKPNALLVGAAGVGKTKIVEDIARRIELGDTLIPDQLKGHTIFELPISDIIAGTGIVGSLETKVKEIVEYASDPKKKVILFMDEIHLLVGGAGGGKDSTYSKVAQILKPALARGDMRVIGATTLQESRALDSDPAFARRFSRLIVDELTSEQTLEVLQKVRTGLIAHYKHQITISDAVLASVVRIADENNRASQHRPDNAITLLDRAMASRVLEQKRLITQATISGDQGTLQALQALSSVPLTENRVLTVAKKLLTGNAVKHALDVEELRTTLYDSLEGQDDVTAELVDRLAREQLNLFPRSTPIAWMFAGASGVGKTETAKIIAQLMTGTEPIILNMTEFHNEASIHRIIGAPPGYVGSDSNAELPFDSLESNPYRVILLDEFEKGDRAVQRLFLSALDEGVLKTSAGKTIDFSKALVIATTNAARESLKANPLGFNTNAEKISTKALAAALAEHFDAELLGRFSLLVGFNPIKESTYSAIVASTYVKQRAHVVGVNPRLGANLPDAMAEDDVRAITEATYVASQGARPAYKAVRTFIEDLLMAAQQSAAATASITATAPVAGAGAASGAVDKLDELDAEPVPA